MFAMFDENPAMTLQDIKETKHYGRTDARTHAHTDARMDNVKTVHHKQSLRGYKYVIKLTENLNFCSN